MTERTTSPGRKSFYKHPEVFGSNWHWRTVFLFSIILKTYFSLSHSYIHPDEHFQGPEATADHVFGWATKRSWEFTSDAPVRSYFVAWIVYGLPMAFIEIFFGSSHTIEPIIVLYSLRLVFTLGTWILSDMAIDRLTKNKQHRLAALFFYGTSYVSWTYQSHTFSNSVETVILLWTLVIIHELKEKKRQFWLTRDLDAAMLGGLIAFGTFNRVTFPVFLIIPGLQLLPWFIKNPLALMAAGVAFVGTSVVAIYVDTICFSIANNEETAASVASTINQFMDEAHTLRAAPAQFKLVVAPLNNFLYNINASNLALHGVHSRFMHVLVNLPQLMGPALILLISTQYLTSLPFLSAFSGLLILSYVQHQEVRFIIPVIPLLCCCLDFTIVWKSKFFYSLFFAVWFIFNILMGALMGIYHQGGVISAQEFISRRVAEDHSSHMPRKALSVGETLLQNNTFVWWKTYSPPIWLLGQPVGSVQVIDPKVTIAGGGDNVFRYEPVFSYLAQIERSLGNTTDYSFLEGPSKLLKLDNFLEPVSTYTSRSSSITTASSTMRNSTIVVPSPETHNPYMTVIDTMGASPPILNEIMSRLAVYTSSQKEHTHTYLVAPLAVFEMNPYLGRRDNTAKQLFTLEKVWETKSHLSLDDLDFSDLTSLTPGLGIWEFKLSY